MAPEFPLINGIMYSWASIKLGLLGSPMIGYTAINYGEKYAKENLYGQGRRPIGRGYGNIEANGSLTLYKDTILALQKIAPFGNIGDIPPFDINVFYINKSGKFVKEVLKNVDILENVVDGKQGDMGLLSTIPLLISHVNWAK